MTIEEQKKADTAKAEAEAKAKADKEKADAEAAEDESNEDESEDEEEADGIDKNPDYEAELQKERKAREDAEKALADNRFKESERRRKAKEIDNEDDDEDDEDKPLTKKELQAILAYERQTLQKESQSDRISDYAKTMSESEAEANLIVEIHKNRTWPTHLSLKEQVEEAHAIANRKKLMSKNSEMARALRAKDTASKDFAGTQRDGMEGTAPKLSPNDTASYKRAGFTFDTKRKVWIKKLPSGKILNKDPRTKRTYIS